MIDDLEFREKGAFTRLLTTMVMDNAASPYDPAAPPGSG